MRQGLLSLFINRTRISPHWAAIVTLMVFLSAVSTGPLTQTSEASELDIQSLSVEEVLLRLKDRPELPVGTRFRQDHTFRALIFSWRFSTRLEKTVDGYEATTENAPSFMPDSLPIDLISLVQTPSLFDLDIDEIDPDGKTVVLRGPREGYRGSGAKDAAYWVDTVNWVVEKAEAEYSWGSLHVTQDYREEGGYLVLNSQSARVRPLGFTLEVGYRDYRLPE